ncbi:MAG TPA: hypothetical protein VI669_16780 [Vicinamibacteria bacterium]|jgi:putative transport protein
MTHAIAKLFQSYPEIAIFLALATGYALGKLKIRGFGLGTTASVLLVAMVLGQIEIAVPALLQNLSFALFAFCIVNMGDVHKSIKVIPCRHELRVSEGRSRSR